MLQRDRAEQVLRRLGASLITFVLVAATVTTASSASPAPPTTSSAIETPRQRAIASEVARLEREHAEISAEEARLAAELTVSRREAADLDRRVRALDLEVTEAMNAAAEAQARAAAASSAATIAQARAAEADTAVETATATLRAHAVAAYVRGGDVVLLSQVLVPPKEPLEPIVSMAYASALLDNEQSAVRELRAGRAAAAQQRDAAIVAERDADDARAAARAAADELAAARTDLDRERAAAVGAAAHVERLLAQVRDRRDATVHQIDELSAESRAITDLLRRKAVVTPPPAPVKRAPSSDPTPTQPPQTAPPGRRKLTFPTTPAYPIVSGYGMRLHPVLGIMRLHAGVDIGAPAGATIVAAADGVVVWASPRNGYGNCLIIDHGDGLATVYAHQSQIIATVGQHVAAGETIGKVGSTGLSAGPHLHFEVRINGEAVDPRPWL